MGVAREQYDKKASAVRELEKELKTVKSKLDAAQLNTVSQEQVSSKKIQTLQSQVSSLSAQLEQANDNASTSDQKLKGYQAEVDSMQTTIMGLSTDIEAKEMEVSTLKNELVVVKEEARLASEYETRKTNELLSEIDKLRLQMSDKLVKANVEITEYDSIIEYKERMIVDLKDKLNQVESDSDAQAKELKKKVNDLTNQIKEEQKLRYEALQVKSSLEKDLLKQIDQLSNDIVVAKSAVQDKDKKLQELTSQLEDVKTALETETDKSRQLQTELERVKKDSNKSRVLVARQAKDAGMTAQPKGRGASDDENKSPNIQLGSSDESIGAYSGSEGGSFQVRDSLDSQATSDDGDNNDVQGRDSLDSNDSDVTIPLCLCQKGYPSFMCAQHLNK